MRLPDRHILVVSVYVEGGDAQTLHNPRQLSGQEHVRSIYNNFKRFWKSDNIILVVWIPSSDQNKTLKLAKREARQASKQGSTPRRQVPVMQSTTLNPERRKMEAERSLPDRVGKHTKRVDAAFPGPHTRQLYDNRPWTERSALAQLRTGMTRLNNSLYRIKAAPSTQCECGREQETVSHFLFRCPRWETHRRKMYQCTETQKGNISFFLGGKGPSDGPDWKPNMKASASGDPFCTGHETS